MLTEKEKEDYKKTVKKAKEIEESMPLLSLIVGVVIFFVIVCTVLQLITYMPVAAILLICLVWVGYKQVTKKG